MKKRAQIEAIIRNLQDTSKNLDANKLSENVIAYEEYRKTFKHASLYQFGISPDKVVVRSTTKGEDDSGNRESAVLELAETYIKDIFGEKTHKNRKEKIESALSLLIGLYKTSKEKLQPQPIALSLSQGHIS